MAENWEKGDVAICISKTDTQPLRIGREYIVDELNKCPHCGKLVLDVGFDNNNKQKKLDCSCGGSLTSEIWWFDAIRFRKKPKEGESVELSDETSETILKQMDEPQPIKT